MFYCVYGQMSEIKNYYYYYYYYMHVIVIYTCTIFSCKIQHAMRGVLYYFAY